MKALAAPFNLNGKEVFTSVSVGIALSNAAKYELPDEILRDADTAMYRAKSLGKARYEVFDADMRASVMARLQLEMDLHRAIERQEFSNFYQPIISLVSGEIVGFESLLRWNHPTRGHLGPEEFIAVAEETGLIRELGWWNLRESCRQMSLWRAKYPAYADLTISVNLSPKQFLQPELISDIEGVLLEMKMPPSALKLELTESTVMGDPASAIAMLEQIKARGISLAIDDFGTGYSCLGYLPVLPFSALKIDRTFVRRLQIAPEVATMIQSLIELSKKMNLRVIVEGVEEPRQLEAIRQMGADELQGYLLGMPSDTPRIQFADHLAGRPILMKDPFPAPEPV
jgi:EAL domain-containing protein (putative c-di-GMP-specific phosphodiesterase class I)